MGVAKWVALLGLVRARTASVVGSHEDIRVLPVGWGPHLREGVTTASWWLIQRFFFRRFFLPQKKNRDSVNDSQLD